MSYVVLRIAGEGRMKKWSVVRRIEHGWDGFDGLMRIRLKNRDRREEERQQERGTRK